MTEPQPTTEKSHWGKGVWLLYGGFISFIIAIVIFAAMQRFDLVQEDYYQKDLAYQGHLEKSRRIESLRHKPRIEYSRSDRAVRFAFPDSARFNSISGELELFRPSDATLDKTMAISLDRDKRMTVPTENLQPGLWRVRVNFTLDSVDYYIEDMFTID